MIMSSSFAEDGFDHVSVRNSFLSGARDGAYL